MWQPFFSASQCVPSVAARRLQEFLFDFRSVSILEWELSRCRLAFKKPLVSIINMFVSSLEVLKFWLVILNWIGII